jgi:hypothetical protein
MHRASARLALAFGIFLAIAEAVRNWGSWQWWPFWVVDYIAVGLLVSGAVMTFRDRAGARAMLSGAWGFTTAMFYMSFWSHIEHIHEAASGNVEQGPLTVIIGVLWATTIVGFVTSLAGGRADIGPSPGAGRLEERS